MIITKLIVSYLVCRGVFIILGKYGKFEAFEEWASKCNWKLIFKMSKCDFCIEHHLAIIPCLGFSLYFGWDWIDGFLPLMVSSLNNILKQ